jgi:hypothetical protein
MSRVSEFEVYMTATKHRFCAALNFHRMGPESKAVAGTVSRTPKDITAGVDEAEFLQCLEQSRHPLNIYVMDMGTCRIGEAP